jgi:hypothetical protein
MNTRFNLFRRAGVYYCEDTTIFITERCPVGRDVFREGDPGDKVYTVRTRFSNL